ncbi:MAG: SOS response-associated peptidase [Clostridia bacterium]|nr:SOS response-associated peptidase [Clostridia bacterium]
MCGRFYVEADDTPEQLRQLLEEAERRAGEPLASGEVCPGSRTAVVAVSRRTLKPAAFAMRWGYPLDGKLLINARSETAERKPLFSRSMRERRCLIPATAWFEWDHRRKPAAKYAISPADSTWFYLAGIYRYDDRTEPEYTILTREASDDLRGMHPRMPVALPASLGAQWLSPSCDPARLLSGALTRVRMDPAGAAADGEQISIFEA